MLPNTATAEKSTTPQTELTQELVDEIIAYNPDKNFNEYIKNNNMNDDEITALTTEQMSEIDEQYKSSFIEKISNKLNSITISNNPNLVGSLINSQTNIFYPLIIEFLARTCPDEILRSLQNHPDFEPDKKLGERLEIITKNCSKYTNTRKILEAKQPRNIRFLTL